MFVIKFIEHLAFGKDVTLIRPERVQSYRRELALLLFENANK